MKRIARYIYRKIRLRNMSKDYDKILTYLKCNKIKVVSEKQFFKSKSKKGPIIILRHDVDRDVEKIVKIKNIEMKYGFQSTLHLRTRNKGYLKKISRAYLRGFDISLHFEFNGLEEAKKDKRTLEKIVGKKIFGCSMHGGSTRTKLSKERLLRILKETGFKYIGDFNKSYRVKKEQGIIFLPYMISDIGTSSFKEMKRTIDNLIKKRGVSELNIHTEYL